MQDKIQVEDINGVQRKILIQVSANSVDKKFVEFFEGIKKDVQIPGFRKGKAPVNRIKQYFGNKARASVSQIIISDFYSQAIRDYDISPIGNPTIQNYNLKDDKYPGHFGYDNSYSVELLVETLPKVDPVGYKDIVLNSSQIDLKEEIEKNILEYRTQFAEHIQITDRPAEYGDSLVVDFAGYFEGEVDAIPGTCSEGFHIQKLGESNLIPGFEEQIVGMHVGDNKTISVIFPENYNANHLANKKVNFDVRVNSIVATKLAEVDDDLALMAGFESTEELYSGVEQAAIQSVNNRERKMLEEQIIAKLLDDNKFDVPKSMVTFEIKRLIEQTQGPNMQQSEDILNILRPIAERNVMKAIIIDAIYDKEDEIEINPEELDALLEDHANKNNTTKDNLVSMLYRSNQMDAFMGTLRYKKVIDYIIKLCDNKEKVEN